VIAVPSWCCLNSSFTLIIYFVSCLNDLNCLIFNNHIFSRESPAFVRFDEDDF